MGGSRGATASLGLMSILKCHVTVRNGVLIVSTLLRLDGGNVSTRAPAMRLPRSSGTGIRATLSTRKTFIFFQWARYSAERTVAANWICIAIVSAFSRPGTLALFAGVNGPWRPGK